MAHSNVLIVAVVALLAACATCVPDTAAAVAVQEAGSVDSSLSVGARDLLRRRRKRTTKKRVDKAESLADNLNIEGVLINQQTTPKIDGNDNLVVGGETFDIFNANVDIGDILPGRRLKSVGGGARDLLRRRSRKKKTTKKNIKRSRSAAANANDEGVLINQQTNPLIEGNSNLVVGGGTSPIFNANADLGNLDFGKRLLGAPGGGARDLLRKRRKRTKKTTKKNIKRSRSAAQNVNNEGVLVNQQTNALIEGNGNTVEGGFAGEIRNFNFDIGDINPPLP